MMQLFVNGLVAGSSIAVMGLAFTMVYMPTRVFHVALGAIYSLAPFVAWEALRRGWGWPAAIALALLASLLISVLCELFNHRPLERRGAAASAHLISSLGIYILVAQAAALFWGNEPKSLRAAADLTARLGTVVLTRAQGVSLAVALAVIAAFFGWLRLSQLGLHLRAMADNPTELALRGHDLSRLRLLAFSIAGVLMAAVSITTAFDRGFDPHTGLPALVLAVVAAIIGGRDSFLGPILAGLLLGVVRSWVVWSMSARWQEAVTFLLLAIFLFARPHGLLGRRQRVEAEP